MLGENGGQRGRRIRIVPKQIEFRPPGNGRLRQVVGDSMQVWRDLRPAGHRLPDARQRPRVEEDVRCWKSCRLRGERGRDPSGGKSLPNSLEFVMADSQNRKFKLLWCEAGFQGAQCFEAGVVTEFTKQTKRSYPSSVDFVGFSLAGFLVDLPEGSGMYYVDARGLWFAVAVYSVAIDPAESLGHALEG